MKKRLIPMASLLLLVVGCGGSNTAATDTTAPSISALVDANGNTISATASENTTRLSALTMNAYTVRFSVPMDPDTLVGDHVTLTCGGTVQTITLAAETDSDGIADNEFVITPAAQLPQYTDCTLTFGTGVKNAAGTALVETAFTYNTKCATNDDFSNAATFVLADAQAAADHISGCWTHYEPDGAGAYTFAISDGKLNFDGPLGTDYSSVTTNRIGIYKLFTATDLTVSIDLASVAGISTNGDRIRISLYENSDVMNADTSKYVVVDFRYQGAPSNIERCQFSYPPSTSPAVFDVACTSGTIESLKIVKTGTTLAGYYKLNSGDYVQIGTSQVIDVGSPYRVALSMSGAATDVSDNIVSFDSFTVSGGSATDQD